MSSTLKGLVILCLGLLMLPAVTCADWVVADAGVNNRLHDVSYPADGMAWMSDQDGHVYHTSDGGMTWTEQVYMEWNNFEGIGFGDSQFGTVCNMGGAIHFTTDGGANWETETEGWMVTFYDAHTLPGTQTAFVAGKNTIFQPYMMFTTDGWATRQSVSFYPTFNNTGYEGHIRNLTDVNGTLLVAAIGIFDGTGAICSSSDGGYTWDSHYHAASTVTDVAFADEMNGAATTWSGSILRTTDGGSTWTVAMTETGTPLHSLTFADANTGYAVGNSGTIYMTADAGATWEPDVSGTGQNLNAIEFFDADSGIIVGDNGAVLVYEAGEPDPVTLTLTPQGAIIIPAEGGSFNYSAHLVSTLPNAIPNVRYWTDVELPNGQVFGPLYSQYFTLQPGMDLTATLNQSVPAMAPGGEYTYNGYVGFTGGPYVQSGFTFTKVAGGATSALEPSDWPADGRLIASEEAAQPALPSEFSLGPAYPNPFNPSTALSVSLPEAAELSVSVFDINGRQVATLADGMHSAGRHTLTFDASGLSSGIYFVQASARGFGDQVRKVTLMK